MNPVRRGSARIAQIIDPVKEALESVLDVDDDCCNDPANDEEENTHDKSPLWLIVLSAIYTRLITNDIKPS